jgi:hypothetical protein
MYFVGGATMSALRPMVVLKIHNVITLVLAPVLEKFINSIHRDIVVLQGNAVHFRVAAAM